MQEQDGFDYSSFWKRLLASLIDALVLLIPCIILAHLLPFIGGIIVYFFYAPILESSRAQATFGKHCLGLKVADLNGNRISLRSAFIRTFVKATSSMLFFIGHFFMFFTRRKQAVHDLLAETVVLNRQDQVANPPISLLDEWMTGMKLFFKSAFESKESPSFFSEMEKLQNLKERGILTDEEFQIQKEKILKKYDK